MKTLLIFLFTLILIRNGVLYVAQTIPDKHLYYGIQQEKELRMIINKVPQGIAINWVWVKL